MKIILYFLSGILIAPGTLLALYLWIITQFIQEGVRRNNLFKTFFHFLIRAVEWLDWAFWIIPIALALWLILAFIPKYQFLGALGMAVVATASLIVMFVDVGEPIKWDGLFIPVLSFAGLLLSLWLVWSALFTVPVKQYCHLR